MKKLYLFLLFTSVVFGAMTQISITSDSFEASENEHKSTFLGNVVITKLNDIIQAKKAIVFFDQENKPIKYQAIEDVNFSIDLNDSTIKGKCDDLIFVPKSKVYTLKGKVDLLQLPSNRKIKATKVIIETKTNKINITGDKNKPVKFIFEVEDK